MKITTTYQAVIVVGVIVTRSNSLGWSSASVRISPARQSPPVTNSNSNASELLQNGSKKSEVFNQALSLLLSLENSPSCYRTAARVLVNNCQVVEQSWATEQHRLQDPEMSLMDYKYGYAISLAVCDLTAAKKRIPSSCDSFRESNLQHLSVDDQKNVLQVKHRDVEFCMESLIEDSAAWTSFTGNKEQAFTICQASREHIERDEILYTYKKTGLVVETFGELLEAQIATWKKESEARDLANKHLYEDVFGRLDQVKAQLVAIPGSVYKDMLGPAKDINDFLRTATEKSQHISSELEVLYGLIRERHTHHVIAQRSAAEAHSEVASRIRESNFEMVGMQVVISAFTNAVKRIQTTITNVEQRIASVEKNTLNVHYLALNNTEQLIFARDIGNDHLESLQTISGVIADVVEDAEKLKSILSTKFLFTTFAGVNNWVLVISTFVFPFLGSYGLQPSLLRNISLSGAGFLMPILYNLLHSRIIPAITTNDDQSLEVR